MASPEPGLPLNTTVLPPLPLAHVPELDKVPLVPASLEAMVRVRADPSEAVNVPEEMVRHDMVASVSSVTLAAMFTSDDVPGVMLLYHVAELVQLPAVCAVGTMGMEAA